MRQGIFFVTALLIFFAWVAPIVSAEGEGTPAPAVETKPAEQPAAAPAEAPKAEEKKAEAKPQEQKPAEKQEEKKPEPEPQPQPAQAPAENKPAEQPAEAPKPQEQKPEEKPAEKPAEEQKPQEQQPAEKTEEQKAEEQKKLQWVQELQKKHEVFLEWFNQNYDNKYQELIKLRDSDPDRFVQLIGDALKIYGPILHEEKRNPELANCLREDLRLKEQRDGLIHDISKAPENQRQALIDQLKGVVSARFDIIITKKQLQYDQLRLRLDKLNQQLESQADELQKLKSEKEAKVQQRIEELLSHKEGVDWN